MRRRDAVAIALLVALAGAGCSRVAFVKTDPSRKNFEVENAPVEVHETAEGLARTNARNALILSQERLRAGDLVNAAKYANQALKADPKSPDPHTLLAIIADAQGQSAQAGASYLQATKLAPNDGRTLNNYGAWLCKNGQNRESLEWFDRALAAPGYSTPAAALANAGRCALDAGDRARADSNLRQAIALAPDNPVALAALARMQFASGNYMEARAFSERRLAAAPADAEALILASQIEDKLGDSAAAARYVRRLREEFPGAAQGNAGGAKSQ